MADHPSYPAGRARRTPDPLRRARRTLAHIPGATLAMTIPRTVSFFVGSQRAGRRDGPDGDRPTARPTVALTAMVVMEEALLTLGSTASRLPHRADYLRVRDEVQQAEALWHERGWMGNPAVYNAEPPAVTTATFVPAHSHGLPFERMTFASDYEPHPGEPGRQRWLDRAANRTASAWVLRHPGPPRPWLICIHGLGMGIPLLDFGSFRATALHRDLGLNMVFPVLPLHGPRRAGRLGGDGFMSFDQLDTIHAAAQAVWDLRRIVGWVTGQGAPRIGVHGVSLGGYVAALLSTLDPRVHTVIAGIPVSDFPRLFHHHTPVEIRARAIEHHLLGDKAAQVHSVVSPLVLPALMPRDRRFIYAALGDRMATPGQAHELWRHWQEPAIAWYPGNHLGFVWSSKVERFVGDALAGTDLVDPERWASIRPRPSATASAVPVSGDVEVQPQRPTAKPTIG